MYTQAIPPVSPEELRMLIKKLCYKNHFFNQVKYRFSGSAADRKLIMRAYEWNAKLFAGKRRLSGGSYMNGHLVPVAVLILEHWQVLDAELIAAALTHDSLEDFPDSVSKQQISDLLSPHTAHLVFGATKPPLKNRSKNSVAYSHAIVSRVTAHGDDCVFLKCNADRLHNMLTLWGTPAKKRYKLWETEQYFLPLARRFKLPTQELSLAIADQRRRLDIDDT